MLVVPPYWIDAVVMIQANNTYYPFHRVPKFWIFISKQLEAGKIKSSKMVWQEVSEGNDELARWVRERKEAACVLLLIGMFKPLSLKFLSTCSVNTNPIRQHSS